MSEELSRRMQEGYLRLTTLESIVQTRDVTAIIEKLNFGNKKMYYGTSW